MGLLNSVAVLKCVPNASVTALSLAQLLELVIRSLCKLNSVSISK